ncbi:hypothetical protein LAV84_18495 [Rhizobium sp. VS19-DR104.2]|uniref:hypothetical protein n=1 Tax=unclassified Rhizobium TaxID=2613769 RepID=UPI001CC36483|nr:MULTISPECIES: hypothetical protein [unclassified Rhizobium]MBZ5761543.1 hypothetical protein [Rhizobium sp. VS19-DR96]MBZ5767491.1 hypothetical protein [Rhizobium sp. VS19-DR129.2]MBZ5775060.1 hypothetical protein [Rhizobium sp. VS19-DRK62.2]MBZ5785975.1 hypothetical protein [Rhizobium sp. VS19-DR121]MBZ5803401.1 hypothetical protein [Rhizobium sp. VS19-DR181]
MRMMMDTDNSRHDAKLNIWLAKAKLTGLRRRPSRKAVYSIAADLCAYQADQAMVVRFFDSARDLYLARDYLLARLSSLA